MLVPSTSRWAQPARRGSASSVFTTAVGVAGSRVWSVDTIWVFGDQLNRRLGPLRSATPATSRVLMVESRAKLASKRWHRQRAHLVVCSMRRFAAELVAEGFEVDYRSSASLAAGLAAHRAEHAPSQVVAMEPASFDGLALLGRLGVDVARSDQFLCHYEEFGAWAAARRSVKMEDFYRWQRGRLGYLMDDGEPVGGRWNFDADNRERPPRDGRAWPEPLRTPLDDLDRSVLADHAGQQHQVAQDHQALDVVRVAVRTDVVDDLADAAHPGGCTREQRRQRRFERNARVARQVHAGQRLGDLDEVNIRAAEVLVALDAGAL